MKPIIPAYSLVDIVKPLLDKGEQYIDYYVAAFAPPMRLSIYPHRAAYYGIAICTQGSAILLADLEQYILKPGTLITMGPETIRSWEDQSIDYAEEILFFTESFFTAAGQNLANLNDFSFLNNKGPKILDLTSEQCRDISKLLKEISECIAVSSLRQVEIVRSYIHIVLNKVADMYEINGKEKIPLSSDQPFIVLQFKKLLLENYLKLHTVNQYADLLCVSSKHLSQTIKVHTGKTAGKWIQECLILEAKVRLKQSKSTINQIAEALNFSDASFFGKYFKRYVGCTPAAYRKAK